MRWLRQTLACVAFLYAASSVANTLPDLKLAALKFGTVKWELQTIKRLELDKKNGFNLEVVDVAGNVYNRLVLFSGGNIHAASEYFGDCLENCRLWQMFFFD